MIALARRALVVVAVAMGFSAVMMGVKPVAAERDDSTRIYEFSCDATLRPEPGEVEVTLRLGTGAHLISWFHFFIDTARHADFTGDGEIEQTAGQVRWTPPSGGGVLRYTIRINRMRDTVRRSYDAFCTADWAVFRGDDLVPPARILQTRGAQSRTTLRLHLPEHWQAVTPYRADASGTFFFVDRPETNFDRPTGWIMAGKLDLVRRTIAGVDVRIASPKGRPFPSEVYLSVMESGLLYLSRVVGRLPERLTIVGGPDPLWRGGLSGPDSLFIHADRPLIDWDGTSPLFHEIFHVATHAKSGHDGDWATEGLAELYSLRALQTIGQLNDVEAQRFLALIARRSRNAGPLRVANSTGDTTRRAVVVLDLLDATIRRLTDNVKSLDDVVRLVRDDHRPLTTANFQAFAEQITGHELSDFFATHVPH